MQLFDIKQIWPWYWSIENVTGDWSSARFNSIHHHPLFPALQQVFLFSQEYTFPSHGLSVSPGECSGRQTTLNCRQTTSIAFTSASTCITWSQEEITSVKQDLSFMKPCWLDLIPWLSCRCCDYTQDHLLHEMLMLYEMSTPWDVNLYIELHKE